MPKVLLVEDDNNLREIFEMRLQAEGYQTVTAGDGEEGLTVAMQQKPDLIICDVMMPKLSGFEMLETLRTAPEGKDVKVLMMTALGQAEDRARGEKLGVIKYLVKSQATLEDFARVVREVLPPDTKTSESVQNNSQEGNKPMQEDNSTPTNPTAPDPMTPAADPTTPAAADPMAGAAMGDQQSTDQEQSTVDAQVSDFVNNAPAADTATPAVDSMTPPATGTMTADPAVNPVSTPPMTDTDMPAADTSTDVPAMPPATPPVETPPAMPPATPPVETPPAMPPQTETPPADNSASTI